VSWSSRRGEGRGCCARLGGGLVVRKGVYGDGGFLPSYVAIFGVEGVCVLGEVVVGECDVLVVTYLRPVDCRWRTKIQETGSQFNSTLYF